MIFKNVDDQSGLILLRRWAAFYKKIMPSKAVVNTDLGIHS